MASTFFPDASRHNTLPSVYANWLEFHDNLSYHLRDQVQVQVQAETTGGYLVWTVDRDYYLACVAELLLATRPTQWVAQQLNSLVEEATRSNPSAQQAELPALLAGLIRTASTRRPGT